MLSANQMRAAAQATLADARELDDPSAIKAAEKALQAVEKALKSK
jgi:hypothetical protein